MKQIIAMGGGGFSSQNDHSILDKYILAQSPKKTPKICFLPTATGDSESYVMQFYGHFYNLNCTPSHLSLFNAPTKDLESFILNKDIIYVGGGNTYNMLTLWKAWGLDVILKKAWEQGIILAGLSAGSICWFEQGVTDSIPQELNVMDCLGFLKGSNCPHYDSEPNRRPTYHQLIKEQKIKAGIATDDDVALHYIDNELVHIVSANPTAHAYYLGNDNGQVIEKKLQPILLNPENIAVVKGMR